MNDDLLARGGMHKRLAPGHDGDEDRVWLTKYNGSLDPAGLELLGNRLVEALSGSPVDAVIVWDDPEDLVLAHVIARERHVAVVQAFNDDGLVQSVGTINAGDVIVAVSDSYRDETAPRALEAVVRRHGGRLGAIGLLVDPQVDLGLDVPIVSLGLTPSTEPEATP